MDRTETRQRRPEELGQPYTLSIGVLPAASEDGPLSVSESHRVAPKPLGTELSRETALSIGLQVTVPFLFAGLGLSGAGILLNSFQHWPVFVEVKDLLTLVPPLVGLKGNLEMTLASRLSTAVSGHLEMVTTAPLSHPSELQQVEGLSRKRSVDEFVLDHPVTPPGLLPGPWRLYPVTPPGLPSPWATVSLPSHPSRPAQPLGH
ncbi:LOW QUALITY PROTEIN: hypothetical protein MC885_018297, partial [Smutsia gigantea]